MKHYAWLTDIHLNFVAPDAVEEFVHTLAELPADGFLLTGDIGEAPDVLQYLNYLDTQLGRPVYFVLGNHDYYRGSIAGIRAKVESLCIACPNLHWLPRAGVIRLTETTALVGHDGWGDGRLGDYQGSEVFLNDWHLIDELAGFDKAARLARLQALGDEAAEHLRNVLPEALAHYYQVIVLTHVPPFRESCWHAGRISDDDWLPHFSCKAIGDVLAQMMTAHADRRMTVLCGHTHGGGEAQILPNLKVLTGGAEYGSPKLQRLLPVE
jgi:predicted phosphohydrolase